MIELRSSHGSIPWLIEAEKDNDQVTSQFARTIAAKSRGDLDIRPRKQYEAFKPLIFHDPAFNPALNNTHICHEFEAQFKESDKHWTRVHSRFSKFPRFDEKKEEKMNPGGRGPTKPMEFPSFFEKPQKVFGRQRKIRPFARAHVYTKPVERTPSQLFDGDNPFLGPNSYEPYHDQWSEASKPVCGVVRPMPAFAAPARSDYLGGLFDPEKQFLCKVAEKPRTDLLPVQPLGTSSSSGILTLKKSLKPSVSSSSSSPGGPSSGSQASTAVTRGGGRGGVGDGSDRRSASPSDRTRGGVGSGSGSGGGNEEDEETQFRTATITTANTAYNSRTRASSPDGHPSSSSHLNSRDQHTTKSSSGGGGGGGGAVGRGTESERLAAAAALVAKSRSQTQLGHGHSFLKSAKSSMLDTQTGGMKEDIEYKRIRMKDGTSAVIQIRLSFDGPQDLDQFLPAGASWDPCWGTIEALAEKNGDLFITASSMSVSSPTRRLGAGGGDVPVSYISPGYREVAMSSTPLSPQQQHELHLHQQRHVAQLAVSRSTSPLSRPLSTNSPVRLPNLQNSYPPPYTPDYRTGTPTDGAGAMWTEAGEDEQQQQLQSQIPLTRTTSRRNGFRPPVYLSKKIKQLEAKEKQQQQRQLLEQQQLSALREAGDGGGMVDFEQSQSTITFSAIDNLAPLRHSSSSSTILTDSSRLIDSAAGGAAHHRTKSLPARVADVLPMDPMKKNKVKKVIEAGLNKPTKEAMREFVQTMNAISTQQQQNLDVRLQRQPVERKVDLLGAMNTNNKKTKAKLNEPSVESLALRSLSVTSLFDDQDDEE